jgi:hypothetical protein
MQRVVPASVASGAILKLNLQGKGNISNSFWVIMEKVSTGNQYPSFWSGWTPWHVILLASMEGSGTLTNRAKLVLEALPTNLENRRPGITSYDAPLIRSYQPALGEHWAYYASIQSTCGAAFGMIYHK